MTSGIDAMYYNPADSSRPADEFWWDRRFRLSTARSAVVLVAAMLLCGAANLGCRPPFQAAFDPLESRSVGRIARPTVQTIILILFDALR
jgi:hypothetical protein